MESYSTHALNDQLNGEVMKYSFLFLNLTITSAVEKFLVANVCGLCYHSRRRWMIT